MAAAWEGQGAGVAWLETHIGQSFRQCVSHRLVQHAVFHVHADDVAGPGRRRQVVDPARRVLDLRGDRFAVQGHLHVQKLLALFQFKLLADQRPRNADGTLRLRCVVGVRVGRNR